MRITSYKIDWDKSRNLILNQLKKLESTNQVNILNICSPEHEKIKLKLKKIEKKIKKKIVF